MKSKRIQSGSRGRTQIKKLRGLLKGKGVLRALMKDRRREREL